jgi:hypothetical protein
MLSQSYACGSAIKFGVLEAWYIFTGYVVTWICCLLNGHIPVHGHIDSNPVILVYICSLCGKFPFWRACIISS